MKLIVGLGNPGKQYQNSRHNVGFDVVDLLARQWSVDLGQHKHQGIYGKTTLWGEPVILLKPLTFMNRSGQSVVEAVAFYKMLITEILVIADDMNLQLEQIRLRPQGSAGGHNGLQNIIDRLGRDDFSRLRVGIGPAQPNRMVDYVLGSFHDSEKEKIDRALRRAASAGQCWVEHGIEQAMNQFNPFDQPAPPPTSKNNHPC